VRRKPGPEKGGERKTTFPVPEWKKRKKGTPDFENKKGEAYPGTKGREELYSPGKGEKENASSGRTKRN